MEKKVDSLSKVAPKDKEKEAKKPEAAKAAATPKFQDKPTDSSSGPQENNQEPTTVTKTTDNTSPEVNTNDAATTNPSTETTSQGNQTESSEAKNGDTYESLFPEPSVIIESPPQWIWWLLLLVGSIILGLAGFKLVNNRLDNWLSVAKTTTPTPSASAVASTSPESTPTATTTPTASPTPTATTTPTASPTNKTTISMRVLNGTTVSGAAATAKTSLEKAGFTVRTIGNAKTQNYQTSFIYYQSGKKAEAELVKSALTSYNFTLEESSLADPDNILVVIGLK